MIATGGELAELGRSHVMGLQAEGGVDLDALRERVSSIEQRLHESIVQLLESQKVRLLRGTGRLKGPHEVVVETARGIEELEADFFVVATGSRPRVPEFAPVDGERVLTTRQAYPPPELPEHMVVIGSGVTGVEFTHMFDALGSKVTLLVSRQQVLPLKDPEVAAALEDEFMRQGVTLLKGARATGIERAGDTVCVTCEDGRVVEGSHAVLTVGSIPNSEDLGLDEAGVEIDGSGHIPIDHHCRSNVEHIYAAGDVSGKLPLSSVGAMQGRKIAEHLMGLHNRPHRHLDYDKAAQAIFTDPEIAEVGLAEAEAFSLGRKIRVTKVPFSSNAKAHIKGDPRGFVKILSDPATGVVLGGSIVGRNAAELISVIAVAVTNGLAVFDIVDSLLVHPTLSESLAEAAS
jgi:dihydrolipoamide dehydrogenase